MRPLDGIRVVDISRAASGPYCTMMLADMGAEVIKVEPPEGDESRRWDDALPGDLSAYFFTLNRGKKGVVIDIKKRQGLEMLKELIIKADVFVENFRPGVAEEMGLGFDELSFLNSRLVYCSISAFGPRGPWRNKPGYDIIGQAVGGTASITGEKGGRMIKSGAPIADFGAGMIAAYGIILALYARDRTGQGQKVETSLLESQLALIVHYLTKYWLDGKPMKPMGNDHAQLVPYQSFETKDLPLIVGVGSEKMWARLCKAIGRPELTDDPRFATNVKRVENRQELIPELEKIFRTRTRSEWMQILDEADVPNAPIQNFEDLRDHPQLMANDMISYLYCPDAGPVAMPSPPVRLSTTPARIADPAPSLGQHTEEVLRHVLGYDWEKIWKLKAEGVIA